MKTLQARIAERKAQVADGYWANRRECLLKHLREQVSQLANMPTTTGTDPFFNEPIDPAARMEACVSRIASAALALAAEQMIFGN